MPLLKLQTSVMLDETRKTSLAKALSALTAKVIGKPESYVMVVIAEATVSMAGEVAPGAFVDVRSIGGLNPSVNGRLSQEICTLLNDELSVAEDRVYINFVDVERANWGWAGRTF